MMIIRYFEFCQIIVVIGVVLLCGRSEAASFDCEKARTKFEKMICDDTRLSDIDTELGKIYSQLRKSLSKSGKKQLKKEQIAWLKHRNRSCPPDDDACLLLVYEKRIAVLESKLIAANDPSMTPLAKTREGWRSGERYRMLADFNGDEIEDMALSTDISLFGKAGGNFDIYLRNGDGELRKYDSFFCYPGMISLEKTNNEIRIWVYIRYGGWVGTIGYHKVEKKGLSEFEGLTIHPGDSGTKMGNTIIEAVFKNSDIKFEIERSETVDGKVKWMEY